MVKQTNWVSKIFLRYFWWLLTYIVMEKNNVFYPIDEHWVLFNSNYYYAHTHTAAEPINIYLVFHCILTQHIIIPLMIPPHAHITFSGAQLLGGIQLCRFILINPLPFALKIVIWNPFFITCSIFKEQVISLWINDLLCFFGFSDSD